jgi:hypothetical protein
MTAARQRLLALGLLLLAIGFVWLVVIMPVTDAFAEQQDSIDQSHQMLAAYQSRIALRPLVEARLAELKSHETSATGLIGGASAELAAANVQNLVKGLIESESGQVHSAQNLPPVTAGGFQRIDIQYDVSLPMTHLKSAAYRIETSTPYLFLDGIDLRAPENWETPGQQIDPPNLEVRWTVRAYRWTGAR